MSVVFWFFAVADKVLCIAAIAEITFMALTWPRRGVRAR